MTRCQHCNKLTHSEHLIVEYDIEDQDKLSELCQLKDWYPAYLYQSPPEEYGKLKCSDIYIHFRVKLKPKS